VCGFVFVFCFFFSSSNTADRTVMRGPGEIAGSYLMETVLEQIAHATGLDAHLVREENMYPPTPEGQEDVTMIHGKQLDHYSLPLLWQQIKEKSNFEARLAECKHFNSENRWRKRGISLVPVRYEVSIWPKSATVGFVHFVWCGWTGEVCDCGLVGRERERVCVGDRVSLVTGTYIVVLLC
jgi:xanthine dehydrogenase molybdopterin-binding subunit B